MAFEAAAEFDAIYPNLLDRQLYICAYGQTVHVRALVHMCGVCSILCVRDEKRESQMHIITRGKLHST